MFSFLGGMVMLNIGVDISKYYHVVHFRTNNNDNKKDKILKISNDRKGFDVLLTELNKYNETDVFIGMESTGHYWKMLALDLQNNGYNIQLINSSHVKRYKEIEDNTPNKNDYKDSRIISKLLFDRKGLHANIYNDVGIYSEIKSAFDCRSRIVEDVKREKSLIRTLIERYFPEYESFFKSGIWIQTSVCFLSIFGFSDLREENLDEIDDFIYKTSKGHIKKGSALKLLNLYKNSIGLREGLSEANYELKYRLSRLLGCFEQLKAIEIRLEDYLDQTEEWEYLKSVPGIGIVLGSGLLSELGDISKYHRSRALVKMSGLNLTSNLSGTIKSKHKISRRGRSKLRHIAYMISLNMVKYDPNVKMYYDKKLSEGKEPVSVLVKISDKALRIVHHLVKSKSYYDSNKVYFLD
jgi:transposase